jgi:hypothetical protein
MTLEEMRSLTGNNPCEPAASGIASFRKRLLDGATTSPLAARRASSSCLRFTFSRVGKRARRSAIQRATSSGVSESILRALLNQDDALPSSPIALREPFQILRTLEDDLCGGCVAGRGQPAGKLSG